MERTFRDYCTVSLKNVKGSRFVIMLLQSSWFYFFMLA